MTLSAAPVAETSDRDRRSFTGDTLSSGTTDSPTLNPSYLLPSNMMPDTPLDDLPASTLEAMATPDPSPTSSKPPALASSALSSSLPRTSSTTAAAATVSFAADLPMRSSSPLLHPGHGHSRGHGHGHGPRRSASSTLLARSNSGFAFPSMSAAAAASPTLASTLPSSRAMSVSNLAGLVRAGASTASLSALAAASNGGASGGRNSPRPGMMLKGSASYARMADAAVGMRGAAARHSFSDMSRAVHHGEYEYGVSSSGMGMGEGSLDGWELERSMSTMSLHYPHAHAHASNMNGFSSAASSSHPHAHAHAHAHFGNASSPAIFPAIQQHLLQHTHAAFLWHPTSASAPTDTALTRQGNAILALYHAQLRDLPLGLPSSACSLSIATPSANPTPLRQLGLQLPPASHLIDASDLALVTELLRLTVTGAKHMTIVSDSLGIQAALRHLSESGTVRVTWITSLPIQVVAASVPAVHVQSVDDMLWSSIPRNVSATHLAANANGSSTNLAAAGAAGTGASPLRYTTSAAQLSTMSSTTSMSSAASGHSPNLKPRAPPPPPPGQQQQQSLAPSGASSTSIASMTSNSAFNPHPHPPHVTKWVPLGPPPDPEFIPLRHVSFGPLFHALHHPAIRDRLGPNYAQPIDLSLLGGILKQAMDPFASLKLYLQAAADCGLLRLSHMGSRCLLKVVNPSWLAQWEPYEPDCVLVPGVASAHLQRRTGSVVGLNTLAGADPSAPAADDEQHPLSETELTPFLPLLHAFCMARMRYPPPIRTPAIGPLLKPMFARGDLAPWRKLSEYLADAEKRGVVTLTRLGVNGDVEVAVREVACAGVWDEVRERYGGFREASAHRDEDAAAGQPQMQFGGYAPQQQAQQAHMYAVPPQQQYAHHPMHPQPPPPHVVYSSAAPPMHLAPHTHAYMSAAPAMYHPQPVTALMPASTSSTSPPHPPSAAGKQARSPLATAAAMTVTHQPAATSSSSSGDDDDDEEDDSAFTFTARSSAAATPLHGTSGASRNASAQSSPVHVNQVGGAGPPPGF